MLIRKLQGLWTGARIFDEPSPKRRRIAERCGGALDRPMTADVGNLHDNKTDWFATSRLQGNGRLARYAHD